MSRQFDINNFTWGIVQEVHEIGEYLIVQYLASEYKDSIPTGGHGKTPIFHPYLNGEDTSTSYNSLDEALVGVISLKHDGLNSQASIYFCKMVGII